jgi:prepilin-type N-terminal cleavage/methylation domain-containing protein
VFIAFTKQGCAGGGTGRAMTIEQEDCRSVHVVGKIPWSGGVFAQQTSQAFVFYDQNPLSCIIIDVRKSFLVGSSFMRRTVMGRRQSGFTFIEILIAITLIGILSAACS